MSRYGIIKSPWYNFAGFAMTFPLIVHKEDKGFKTTLPFLLSRKQCSLHVSEPLITAKEIEVRSEAISEA